MIAPAIALLLLAAADAASTPAWLPPVEQCSGDDGFIQFRNALENAVARRDAAALRQLAARNIISDFGGSDSWAHFVSRWSLAVSPQNSELWDELEGVLALGCAPSPDGSGNVMPGMFEAMSDDVDPFELVVALPGTELFDRPTDKRTPIATLEWHSATDLGGATLEGWMHVRLIDGREGWVRTDELISPLGYRLVARKIDGRWLIAAFVSGD